MTRYRLMVIGNDTWTDAKLDRLESSAKGRITEVVYLDPGNSGRTRLTVRPNAQWRQSEREAILRDVRAMAPESRWVPMSS